LLVAFHFVFIVLPVFIREKWLNWFAHMEELL